jgi:hypothetical protein
LIFATAGENKMAAAQAVILVLEMLPETRLDEFLKRLTPQAVDAIRNLDQGALNVPDAVAHEIATKVSSCLETN